MNYFYYFLPDFREVHEAYRIESLSDIKKFEKLEKGNP